MAPKKSAQDITYKSYLKLGDILSAQAPISRIGHGARKAPAHDEMMFIVVHQTYELWFKLVLFEMDRVQSVFAQKTVRDRDVRTVSASLVRIVEILKLMVHQLGILETMTPLDFLDFRNVFRSASGFQSMQFRELEVRLGLKSDARLDYGGKTFDSYLAAEDRARLQAVMKKPSLFAQLDAWLSRTPFIATKGYDFWKSYRTAVEGMIEADRMAVKKNRAMPAATRAAELQKIDNTAAQFAVLFAPEKAASAPQWRLSQKAVRAALIINLYRDEPALQGPFGILNGIMDIDELMALWRYRHALMVQRMLGMKMGSGGSTGHDYLAATAGKHRVFNDLFMISTFLIPRSKLPQLPPSVIEKMGLRYGDKDA